MRNFGNLDEAVVPSVTARARASDVEGLVSEVDKFAVWSNQQQRLRVVAPDELMEFKLVPRASDVLTIAALQVFCARALCVRGESEGGAGDDVAFGGLAMSQA